MSEFINFDEAVDEVDDRTLEFQYEGEMFKVDLNVDAKPMLEWMAAGNRVDAIPALMKELLGDDEYDRLLKLGGRWTKMERLISHIIGKLGRGNAA